MSNVAKIAVPLLLVAAAAGGTFYYLNQPDSDLSAPNTPNQPPPEQPKNTTEPDVKPVEVQQPEQPNITRTEATGPAGTANEDAPQGVLGRVVLPTGSPAANVPVLLMESTVNDPLKIFLRNKTGQASPPIASTVTAADGSFRLGLRKPGQAVDLRVVSDEHPQFSRSQLKVRRGDWYDTGDIQLEQGLLVQGRVLQGSTKLPVTGVTVYMASSHQSHAMVATPGREKGTPSVTDANGFFRFTNAPRTGLINLVAEAEGFASANLLNQQLKPDVPNEFTIEIEAGSTITGVVVDDKGKRIPSAKITALGLSSKTPQTESVVSDGDGMFEFPALRSGPYKLSATASRYADVEIPLALTGDDVKIVMATRGSVKLKVLGANNRPIKAYRLSLKRSFPNNPMGIGNVLDFPDRNINPGDYPGEFNREWALIQGLPSGDFRFQIVERNHAKTLSPMFKIVEGADPVEVVAVLTLGAAITGTVIDDSGKPVSGALVTTDMNAGIAANTGILEIFRTMIPEKHTTKRGRTDRQGRFRIERLAFADYMLRVSHEAYCEGTAIDLTLQQEGQVLDAGVIQLSRGAVVSGVTTVDGQPTGQVKIVVSVPMTPENMPKPGEKPAPGQSQVLFSSNVLSDGDGRYKLLKRVPPGKYKVTAARHSADNPFGALMDMKQTEQELIVTPGQESITLNFNLPSR